MPAASYVNLSGFVKGVASAQASLNIESQDQSWANDMEFIEDRFGGQTGWAEDFQVTSDITITGETNTAVASAGGFAWGSALTLANQETGTFGVTGGAYARGFSLSKNRGSFQSATINCQIIGGIT